MGHGITVYLVKNNSGKIDSVWQDYDDANKQALKLGGTFHTDEWFAWRSFDDYVEATAE